jgi:hypothetical protein
VTKDGISASVAVEIPCVTKDHPTGISTFAAVEISCVMKGNVQEEGVSIPIYGNRRGREG